MDCKQIIDLISMYVDSELDERQKAEFEEHVSQCSSCKEELNDILKVLEVLHSIPEVDLPDNFKDELHEKLIKVKENEFSTGKLFFIKNRYIRAISTVAAGVLIIFVLKGILFDGFLLKIKYDKSLMSTRDTDDAAVMMKGNAPADYVEKANSVNGSKEKTKDMSELSENGNMQKMDEGIMSQDVQKSPDEFSGKEELFTSQFTKEDISEADTPEPDVLKSDKTRDRTVSSFSVTEDSNNTEDSDSKCSTRSSNDIYFTENTDDSTDLVPEIDMFGAKQTAPYEYEDNYILFRESSKINVTIVVKDNVMDEDKVRSIAIENGAIFSTSNINMMLTMETKTEAETETTKDKDEKGILEFLISGNQYNYFLNNLEDNVKLDNVNMYYTSPIIREDVKINLNELKIKLDGINIKIAEVDKENENSNPPELEKLKSDREKIQKEIDKTLEEYEYVADVTIDISK